MKKRNIIMIAVCLVALIVTFSYSVYAVLTTQLRLSNTISFKANGVFFMAVADAYYEDINAEGGKGVSILNARQEFNYENTGMTSENEEEWTNLKDNDNLIFTSNHKTIIYEIQVTSYTENPISFYLDELNCSVDTTTNKTLTEDEKNAIVTMKMPYDEKNGNVTKENPIKFEGHSYGSETETHKIFLKFTLNKIGYGVNYNVSFNVNLVEQTN